MTLFSVWCPRRCKIKNIHCPRTGKSAHQTRYNRTDCFVPETARRKAGVVFWEMEDGVDPTAEKRKEAAEKTTVEKYILNSLRPDQILQQQR